MLKIDPKEEGRFSRFELIRWWDQKRLSHAKALVIGAGALGNEVIKNLCLIGVGNILIADMDRVENSNLSRSILFRESDNGRYKAQAACDMARYIYPNVKAEAFIGNIVHDLGLGAYLWADVIVGGLDNNEARVAMNAGAAFARKPWIDGAIEVLDGVARVFHPHEGSCFECVMSATDWKNLQNRRSCALLTKDEMIEGRVPTTPTSAGIIAALEAQEALKIIHGMETMKGGGLRYSGLQCEFYPVKYPRKPNCYGHETWRELRWTGLKTTETTVGDILDMARKDLGKDAVVELSRDVIRALDCPVCGARREFFASLGKVTLKDAVCPSCSADCAPDTMLTLGLDHDLDDKTLSEIGVPLYDAFTARNGESSVSYVFDGDAREILGGMEIIS
ncbi:ThiF family adenylyltransferase [Candidatus Sumerlaeota bacterium]|nr:ThiF family adenylyltransferase [Candidatus Sumerlaeota bacterium]